MLGSASHVLEYGPKIPATVSGVFVHSFVRSNLMFPVALPFTGKTRTPSMETGP